MGPFGITRRRVLRWGGALLLAAGIGAALWIQPADHPVRASPSTTPVAPNHFYITIPTRPGVLQGFLLVDRADPIASAILFVGGDGRLLTGGSLTRPYLAQRGLALFETGSFLMSVRQSLAEAGFLVALIDTPSDRTDLDGFRTSRKHAEDVRGVIAWLRRRAHVPVWLIGSSRGAVSAASAAAALQGRDGPDGLVLISSLLRRMGGREPATTFSVALGAIDIPVLIVHHQHDACPASPYSDLHILRDALGGAQDLHIESMNGGAPGSGNPCSASHHHGYIGQQEQVVTAISRYIHTHLGRIDP